MNSGKVTITFDMSDPDQKYEAKVVQKADDMKYAIDDMYQTLRNRRKHNPPKTKEGNEVLEEIWTMFFDCLKDRGLSLDD